MLARVITGTIHGVNGLLIEVETDIAPGLPIFSTVGLAEGAVREAKDRVKSAVRNSGYNFPNRKITVNLAPADLKKVGSGYDLPIAISILVASEIIAGERLKSHGIIGELSLDGSVREVTGVLPMVIAARDGGLAGVLVPAGNAGRGSGGIGHQGDRGQYPLRGRRIPGRKTRDLAGRARGRPRSRVPPSTPTVTISPRCGARRTSSGPWRSPPPAATTS